MDVDCWGLLSHIKLGKSHCSELDLFLKND